MGVDGKEMRAGWIDTCYNKVCADVSLISEEMLLQHGHASDDTRLAASGEGVEFEVRGNDGGSEFCVGGGSSSCTPNLR